MYFGPVSKKEAEGRSRSICHEPEDNDLLGLIVQKTVSSTVYDNIDIEQRVDMIKSQIDVESPNFQEKSMKMGSKPQIH